MSLDELDEFYRQQRRARIGSSLMIPTAAALTIDLIRAIPTPEPTVSTVDIRPDKPQTLRIGDPAPTTRQHDPPSLRDTADTGPPPAVPGDPEANEDSLLEQINAERARGVQCGSLGDFPPSPALIRHDSLAEAALGQAQWLEQTGERAHETPSSPLGGTPLQRAHRHGYEGNTVGEALAWSRGTVTEVLRTWMISPIHCRVLMHPEAIHVGVGQSGPVWTVLVGAP